MRPKILVIDDEVPIRFALERYFSSFGCRVDTAGTAADAHELLGGTRYEAAIVDLRLSGVEDSAGLEMVEAIHRSWPGTRILMLTAYGTPEIEEQARRRGAAALIHKPKPLEEIARVLTGLLGASEGAGAGGAC